MTGPRYEFYVDAASLYRWRLVAGNGEVVASGEAHNTEADARRAANRARDIFNEALMEPGNTEED